MYFLLHFLTAFKLSINWHGAVVLDTCNWKLQKKKLNFYCNFLSLALSLCTLIIYGFRVVRGFMQPEASA